MDAVPIPALASADARHGADGGTELARQPPLDHPTPAIVAARTLPASALERTFDLVLRPSFDTAELCTPAELLAAVADGAPALVALEDEEPVGAALGEHYAGGRVLLLAYLAVAPGRRGGGLGGALLERFLEEWQRRPVADVVLAEVEDPRCHRDRGWGNPHRRLEFYRRHGARVLPVRHVQPALRPGLARVRDLLLLAWAGSDEVGNDVVRAFLDEYYDACEGTREDVDAAEDVDAERARLRNQVAGDGALPLKALAPDRLPPLEQREVVERDAPVLDVMSRALATTEAAARSAFDRAWAVLAEPGTDVANRDTTRQVLATRLLTELRAAHLLAETTSEPDRRFLPEGDRWAGWWVDDVQGWPQNWSPPPEAVLAALRDLPVQLRLLLLMADVAGLAAEAVAQVAGTDAASATVLLRRARTEYVRCLHSRVSTT